MSKRGRWLFLAVIEGQVVGAERSAIGLTDAEVLWLWASAYRGQRRRSNGRRCRAAFSDGPLDGVTITVTMHEAAGHYLGFCVVTEEGLMQAVYRKGDEPSVWRFERLESGQR